MASKTRTEFTPAKNAPPTTSAGFWWSVITLAGVGLGLVAFIHQDRLLGLTLSQKSLFFGVDKADELPPQYIVDTGYARYLGNQTYPNVVAYLGVPYAEPPLGDRRYRKPLPLDKVRVTQQALSLAGGDGITDARNYPDFCIQGSTFHGDAGGAGSEDCLKVNIYAPVDAQKGSKLPVLVYIHGGGYIYGNPQNWPFDHWVQQSPNVVIVSIYYRLSSFGFLASSALAQDSSLGDLNAGFLDQIQALEWIQENIDSFGGDPNKVTISGESAGATSVVHHLTANGGKSKLFQKAIAQSVYRTPVPQPREKDELFNFLATQVGCSQTNIASIMDCLRQADISALARAQDSAMYNLTGYNFFQSVVDGKVIPDYPTVLIKEGKFADVPLIVGATSDETLSNGEDIAASLKTYFPSILDEDINTLIWAYPLSSFSTPQERFDTLTGDSEFRCSRSIMASAFSKAWAYRYNQPTPDTSKVWHAAENWMLFKGMATSYNGTATFTALSKENRAFEAEVIAYWLSFVRSGDPNTFRLDTSPIWNDYGDGQERMVLQQPSDDSNSGEKSGGFMEAEGADVERCQLVANQATTQQN